MESPRKNRPYDTAFALVDAFASLEVAAALVIHAQISEGLGLREELSGTVITAYLYPLFSILALALAFDRRIHRTCSPSALFLTGLLLFSAGNGICGLAPAPWAFFLGRAVMSVGAALAFIGQLWTASTHFRPRIAQILVWGEIGAAVGDTLGPLLGAFFAQVAPEGWRLFFLFDAGVGVLAAGLAVRGLRGVGKSPIPREGDPFPTPGAPGRGPGIEIAWQIAISMLLVGSEYLFSDQLQQKMGQGPVLVGIWHLSASGGTILGAWGASRLAAPPSRILLGTTLGLFLSLGGLAASLLRESPGIAGFPLFISGACMGLAGVTIYAAMVASAPPDGFLRCTLLYLLGMQIGNALGVQAVSIAEWFHWGIPASALILAVPPGAMVLGIVGFSRGRRPETTQKSPP